MSGWKELSGSRTAEVIQDISKDKCVLSRERNGSKGTISMASSARLLQKGAEAGLTS